MMADSEDDLLAQVIERMYSTHGPRPSAASGPLLCQSYAPSAYLASRAPSRQCVCSLRPYACFPRGRNTGRLRLSLLTSGVQIGPRIMLERNRTGRAHENATFSLRTRRSQALCFLAIDVQLHDVFKAQKDWMKHFALLSLVPMRHYQVVIVDAFVVEEAIGRRRLTASQADLRDFCYTIGCESSINIRARLFNRASLKSRFLKSVAAQCR